MHIIHTEASQGWGGQEIRILTESLGMLDRGHQVTILTPPKARIYEAARREGIPVVAMPLEKKRPRGIRALQEWLGSHRPDIVNTHSSIDSWLMALTQPLKHRFPVVRTRHISAPLPRSLATRWLYLKAADRVVTTGESLRRKIVESLNANPAHFVSVPTGIDLDRYSRRHSASKSKMRVELGVSEDALLICIAATIRSWKGHSYLLEAFDLLAADYPDLRLLVVGDGPMRPAIEQQAAELKFADRVHFTGHSERVEDMLAAADIFALPSWANEGVPQAIMQAMAMELPVVSTPIGAIDELLVDNKTGLMVRPKDAHSLSDGLRKLIVDPDLRKRFGQAARERVVRYFSSHIMIDSMEQVFLQLKDEYSERG